VSDMPLRRLEKFYLNELYYELCGEIYNIVFRGHMTVSNYYTN